MTKKRAKQLGTPGEKKGGGGGGLMSGMRRGMKRVVGQGGPAPVKKKSNFSKGLDIALWVVVIALLIFVLLKRFG